MFNPFKKLDETTNQLKKAMKVAIAGILVVVGTLVYKGYHAVSDFLGWGEEEEKKELQVEKKEDHLDNLARLEEDAQEREENIQQKVKEGTATFFEEADHKYRREFRGEVERLDKFIRYNGYSGLERSILSKLSSGNRPVIALALVDATDENDTSLEAKFKGNNPSERKANRVAMFKAIIEVSDGKYVRIKKPEEFLPEVSNYLTEGFLNEISRNPIDLSRMDKEITTFIGKFVNKMPKPVRGGKGNREPQDPFKDLDSGHGGR